MAFEIRTPDGRVLSVHTEVGNGLTRVVVEEAARPAPSIEPEDLP